MTTKRLLLTGIGGFWGSHFLEHVLNQTDWHVVGIASWRHKGMPERVGEVLSGNPDWKDRVTIITHDLTAPLGERTIERIGKVDYIVNAAAESHVDRSIEDPVPFVLNNVNVALNVLELARVIKPDVFLQFSTDEVYGAAEVGVNHPEWSPIVPSNPYSASKAMQEDAAIAWWRTYNVPVVITNTMNLFGQMQDPEKYVSKAIRAVMEGRPVTVHGRTGDIGSRYYLHARNAADAVLFILSKPPTAYSYGSEMRPDRYNIVGDIELDNLELAERIASALGKPLEYELVDFHSTRPGHDRRYALDGSKLRKMGWEAPEKFERSLERTVSWLHDKPEWV